MIRAVSTPNIALIKYWGNRNEPFRLPAADSLSMTLDTPNVEVGIDFADTFSMQSFNPDGTEKNLSTQQMYRIEEHIGLMNTYLGSIGIRVKGNVTLQIHSHIPASVGLASSAAVFSGIARAYSALLDEGLTEQEISVMSRLGSGSASRTTYGGFVSMIVTGDGIGDSYAEQIADEDHWKLSDIILIPNRDEKKVGSTEGHALASTSPYFKQRISDIPTRQAECINAILKKDFEKLQSVSEIDALDMHHVMETSTPVLQYLSAETHRIIDEVKALRSAKHLEVLFTMDAGPTVHLLCTEDAKTEVLAYAKSQTQCTIFETQIGPGSHIL